MLAAGIWLLGSVEENSAIVNNLTVSQLGDLVQKLEFFASEWTEAEIRAWLDANLQAAGIAAIILSFVVLGTIGAAVIVLRSSQVCARTVENQFATESVRRPASGCALCSICLFVVCSCSCGIHLTCAVWSCCQVIKKKLELEQASKRMDVSGARVSQTLMAVLQTRRQAVRHKE